MNSREKLLMTVVGLLMLVMVGYYVVSSVAGAVNERRNRLMAAEKKLTDQKNTIKAGANAARQFAQLQTRSLPADREKAQSLYQRWLLELLTDIGIDVQSVRPSDRRISGIYFDRVNFEVDGEASLEQAIEFLHRFYSSNDLHRIQQISLRPAQKNRNSRQLDLSISIETMILPDNKRETVGDLASDRMGDATLQDYATAILGRNIFSPPNAPPSIKLVGNKTVHLGDRLSVQVTADDPDALDRLSYSLVGYVPDGAEIDERSGTISWRPKEIGEVDFSVQVADNGTPRLTDETTFKVTVTEPAPEEVVTADDEFDEAQYAYLVGTISTGPKREIWLSIRTSGQLLRLSEGDRVKVGTITGVVHEIGDKHASIRTDDGELLIRVGQNLSEGRVRPLQQASR